MTASADILSLDAEGQAKFSSLLEESIAALLNILADHVDVVVHNFLNRRRLSMLRQESVLALTRRLTTTDLDVSYTVSTTEDQVSSITEGLTSTVATGLADHLTAAIAADSSLNVTVHGVSDFSYPEVTVVSTGDDVVVDDDSEDGLSTVVIVIIVLVCVSILICLGILFIYWRRRKQPKPLISDGDVDQPSQESKVEAVET